MCFVFAVCCYIYVSCCVFVLCFFVCLCLLWCNVVVGVLMFVVFGVMYACCLLGCCVYASRGCECLFLRLLRGRCSLSPAVCVFSRVVVAGGLNGCCCLLPVVVVF